MKFARTALTQIATYTALICRAGSAQAALNKFADWAPYNPLNHRQYRWYL